jgi:hypothetical protein
MGGLTLGGFLSSSNLILLLVSGIKNLLPGKLILGFTPKTEVDDGFLFPGPVGRTCSIRSSSEHNFGRTVCAGKTQRTRR